MDKIEAEFRALKKGNMTVKEYTRQFMEKLGLVGHVALTEKEKIKAYLKGLPTDMMYMVCNSKASNLRETIEEVRIMEDVYARTKEERPVVGDKRKWESNHGHLKSSRPFNEGRSFDNRREARWCPRCRSKNHGNCNSNPTSCAKCGKSDHATRDFLVKGIVCSECKMPGHFQKDCSKWRTGSAPEKKENPPRVPGRAFQMKDDEAKASTDMVSGTFLLNSVPARVLFDSGASFSFIYNVFYRKLAMPTSSLEDNLVVEIENGGQVVIRMVLKGCVLDVEGKEFSINLKPMLIGGFDVVVEMDWLEENQDKIVCSKKLIRVPFSSGEMVVIYGERRKGDVTIITMAKA
ncbi:hypothetical protein L6452_39166 [Arctium lappa]|uniref:Uncharacterized protein n=1 Tax=Arctium lappa TaxID=4217 RepID=A0ACB8XRK3_ARCLA|nr:hypothetical protein L6452_39166 [Arctium lappa]